MPSPNQRVGEYVLQERIAAGVFGEVWKAHHHVWADQFVAVKIPTDPQYLRNLQREGVAIHGLQHPNIVRAIGFDPYGDPAYLMMEYVPGTSLRPLIKNRTLSIDDTVAIMRQVLAGLGYAHKQNLVHRDVKPENVLIHELAASAGYSADGMVKVTDFGLGKAAGNTGGSIAYSQQFDSPQATEIAGTLDYMAPEQRNGGAPDPRCDLYSCGVMLYEMLTGEKPAGTDLPSALNPKVPRNLDEAFRRSYSRLEKRFATAEEFAAALLSNAPPPLPSPKPRATPPHAPPSAPLPVPPPLVPVNRTTERRNCPQCRQAVDPADQFCMSCGVQLVENVRRCPKCGAYPDIADPYCIFCGQVLSTEVARK